jgi:hypothetical protein
MRTLHALRSLAVAVAALAFIPSAVSAQFITRNTQGRSVAGYNAACSTTPEVLWSLSGNLAVPTAAQSITLSSGSASDDTGGTGAIDVEVTWIDADGAAQTDTVTLNGVAAVAVGSGLRVNRLVVTSAGTGLVNAGIVYAGYGTVDGNGVPQNVLATIAASAGESQAAVYRFPSDGNRGKIHRVDISSYTGATSDTVTARLRVRDPDGITRTLQTFVLGQGNPVAQPYEIPRYVDAGSDVWLDGAFAAGSGAISATLTVSQ